MKVNYSHFGSFESHQNRCIFLYISCGEVCCVLYKTATTTLCIEKSFMDSTLYFNIN